MSFVPFEMNPTEPDRDGLKGSSASRLFRCEWKDRYSYPPKKGELYPGSNVLRCVENERLGDGPGTVGTDNYPFAMCTVTSRYAEFAMLDGEGLWRSSTATDLMEIGKGRRWRFSGTICDTKITVPVPVLHRSCHKVMAWDPSRLAADMVGCINFSIWHPTPNAPVFKAERLQFLGVEVDPWWDQERQAYLYGCVYNFEERPHSHNWRWCPPRPAYDEWGNQLRGGSSTNYDPVYVVDGRWDFVEPLLFTRADFNPMMGLPPSYVAYPNGVDSFSGFPTSLEEVA
jgi:hypothetical protein